MAVGREARDKLLNGQKKTQQWARKALPILVRQAQARQKITYGDLAEMIGVTFRLNLSRVCGCIGSAIQELSEDKHSGDKLKIPLINALVVNKNTGEPGGGIGYYIDKYRESNKAEKTIIMTTLDLYNKICDYPDWPLVLKEFGLKPYEGEVIMYRGKNPIN
jgi:hypothetical protein